MSTVEKTSKRSGTESGEVSADENVPTPLGRIHTNKMMEVSTPKIGSLKEQFNAKNVKDSLERPKRVAKRPRKVSESSSECESSRGIEDSFISALGKKSRGSSISLKEVGLLQNRGFLKQLSVPDRRDLGGIRNWSERFNTLFDLVKRHGGSSYMEFTEALDGHRESLELYLEEYDEPAVFEGLTEIDSLLKIFQKVLCPLSRAAGVGQKITAVLGTEEAENVLGALDANLLQSSVKQANRGVTSTMYGMSPFKLANWTVRNQRQFKPSSSSGRWPRHQTNSRQKYNDGKKSANTLVKNKF